MRGDGGCCKHSATAAAAIVVIAPRYFYDEGVLHLAMLSLCGVRGQTRRHVHVFAYPFKSLGVAELARSKKYQVTNFSSEICILAHRTSGGFHTFRY